MLRSRRSDGECYSEEVSVLPLWPFASGGEKQGNQGSDVRQSDMSTLLSVRDGRVSRTDGFERVVLALGHWIHAQNVYVTVLR